MERRWLLVFCCFLCMLCIYLERVGFSIAYTAVAASHSVKDATKGVVLGAFFNGYACSQVCSRAGAVAGSAQSLPLVPNLQIPGGWAAHRFGGRTVLIFSFVGWSTLSICSPLVLSSNTLILILRVLVGVSQGFVVPSIHSVIAEVTRSIPRLPHSGALLTVHPCSGYRLRSAPLQRPSPRLECT